MKGVLIDLDGVIYQNSQLIEGALASVHWLRQQAIPHLFVTNTTSKPKSAVLQKLANFGLQLQPDDVLTPASAARAYLVKKFGIGASIALCVPEASFEDFTDFTLLDSTSDSSGMSCKAVILGDLAQAWSFERLNRAFNLLKSDQDAELIALGMTRYYQGGEGLQLDVGPFVQALAFASDKQPVIMGKPDPLFFQSACEQLNLAPHDCAMIGDDPVSDVSAAIKAGLTGIQVQTGKYRPGDETTYPPGQLWASFGELPERWGK